MLILLTLTSHLQFAPVCLVILFISYKNAAKAIFSQIPRIGVNSKYRNLLFFAVFLSAIFAAYVFFLPLISSSLSQLLLFLGTKHVGYLTLIHGYELSFQILLLA